MKNGNDENNNHNKSDETKCATNCNFITNNNKWNVNTHIAHQTRHQWRHRRLRGASPSVELAHSAHSSTLDVISHLIGSSPEQTLYHPRSWSWRVLFYSTSPFFLHSFLSFSVYFLHNELFLELDNPIVMESLCYSAAEKSEDTLNASHSFTGYEPNLLTFGELNDSSVPFMIPSLDQDVDDVTLGKMLTEAHRGQVDYCEPEGMSVSHSSSSVRFDGSKWHEKHVHC